MNSDQFQILRYHAGQDCKLITGEYRGGQIQLLLRAFRILVSGTQREIQAAVLAKDFDLRAQLLLKQQANLDESDRLRTDFTRATRERSGKVAIDPTFAIEALEAYLAFEQQAKEEAAKGRDQLHAADVARQVDARVIATNDLLVRMHFEKEKLKAIVEQVPLFS